MSQLNLFAKPEPPPPPKVQLRRGDFARLTATLARNGWREGEPIYIETRTSSSFYAARLATGSEPWEVNVAHLERLEMDRTAPRLETLLGATTRYSDPQIGDLLWIDPRRALEASQAALREWVAVAPAAWEHKHKGVNAPKYRAAWRLRELGYYQLRVERNPDPDAYRVPRDPYYDEQGRSI